jgi:hypothetical protein
MDKPRKRRLWLIPVGILAALFVCLIVFMLLPGGETGDNGTPAPTRTAKVAAAPTDTRTPKPTKAPTDTRTPKTSATPRDTSTPKPTATPVNTATPAATPTPLPSPVTWTGSGDDLVDLKWGQGPSVLHITGNQASRHFAVTSKDTDGNTIDLLVNTTDPYEGYRPLDFRDGQAASRLEVKATGAWSITLVPLGGAYLGQFVLAVPGEYAGSGDTVLLLAGEADKAAITGNQTARHFAVMSYSNSVGLLVNTTDPYQGTVAVPRNTVVLEIVATGKWTISVTAR